MGLDDEKISSYYKGAVDGVRKERPAPDPALLHGLLQRLLPGLCGRANLSGRLKAALPARA